MSNLVREGRNVREVIAEIDHLRDELRGMREAQFPDGKPAMPKFGRDVEIFTRTKKVNQWFAYGYADLELRNVRKSLQTLK